MNNITMQISHASSFLDNSVVENLRASVEDVKKELIDQSSDSEDQYLGWLQLPTTLKSELVGQIQSAVDRLQERVDTLVVIGIGGSYLGAKAVIEALSHSFEEKRRGMRILYAGNQVSEDYLAELVEVLEDTDFGICVISKSGTTTEPAIAFRVLKSLLEETVGEERSVERIIAITDKEKGALRLLANQKGYTSFVIPDNIGGRYSVLTPVGLFPIACGGVNIVELIRGAKEMQKKLLLSSYEDNIALQYAVMRNALYREGKKIEILVNYNPKLQYLAEWWKQLFGESEGKEQKGIFPASLNFTTDLHSMGQYVQDGERTVFETVLSVEKVSKSLVIPLTEENLDSLNYLQGRRLDEVNKSAEQATILAHVDGGVPNLRIVLPELNAYYIGQLIYFFEFSCAVSGRLLGVNPFNQPGVEAYKKNMFALLGKEGYEKESVELKKRLTE